MADDLQTLLNAALLRIPVTEPERDQLWDAFASATDPGDLSTRILATLKRRPNDPVLQKATSELQTLAKASVFQTPGMTPLGAPSPTAVQGVTRPVLEIASALGGESVFNLPARFGFAPSGLDTNEMRRRAQTQDFERSAQAGLWRPTAGASPQLRQAEYEQQARQEIFNTGMAFLGGAVPATLDVATNPVELAARASGFGAAVDLTRAARGMRAAQRAADAGDLARAAEQTARATQAAARAEQFTQAATRVNRGAAGLGVATGAALTAEGLESGDLGQVGQGLAVAGMSGAGAAAQSRYGTMPVQQVARGVGRDVTLRMRDAIRRGQEIVGLRQSPENVVRQSGVFQTLTPTGAASNQVKQADFGTGQAVIAAGMQRLQADGKLPDLDRYDMTQDYYDLSRMAADAGVDQIYDTWAEANAIAAQYLNDTIKATWQATALYNKGQMPEAEYRRFVDQANAARAATVVDPRLDRIQGKITGLYADRPASRAKALQYYNRVRAGKADLPPGVLDAQLPNDTVRYLRDINVERNRFISTRPSDRRVTELTDPEIGVLNAMEAELSDRLIAQLENMGVTEARKMGEAVAITLKMRNRLLENQEKLQSYAEGIPLTTPERVMRTASQGAAGGAAALALGGITPLGAAGGAGAAFTAGRLFGMAREFVRQGQRTTTRNAEMQKWLRNIQQLQEPARYSTPQAGPPVEGPPFPDIRTWPAPKQITEGEVIDAERIYPGSIDPYAPQPRQIGATPPPLQIPRRSSSGMGPQQGPTIDPRTGQPAVVELATPEQYVAQNTPMPRQMRQQLTQEILAQLPANVEIVMTVGPGGEMVGGVGLRSKAGAETAIEPLAAINQGLRQGAVPAPSPDYTIATTRSADGTIRSADVRSTQTNQVARRFVGADAYRKAEAFVYSKDTRRRNSKLSLEYVDDATLLALARPGAAAPTPPPGTAPATGAIEVTPAASELPQTILRSEEPVQPGEPPVVSSSAPFASAPESSPLPDAAPLGVPETATAPPSAELDMFGNPIAPPPISGAVDAQTMAPADLQAAEQAGLIINNFPVRDLAAKPTILQYKRGAGEGGQTGSLKGVKVYDPLLGGVLTVWREPDTGQALVVNGHNRLERAKELGVQTHPVRFIQAQTAEEARAIGAMMNIAEGRGTVFDAANFFRESGITNMDELQARGLPLAESKVSDGFYLSRLHRALYDRVEQKQLPIAAGAGIGRIMPDKNDQLALLKLLDQKKGLATDVILELAEQAAGIKRVSETQVDLFGSNEVSRSLMVEQAQIVAAINRRLTSDRRLFAKVGKESAAEKLAQAGNVIDAEANARQAEQAALVLEVFNRLKSSQFAPLLNQAAERKYQGESLDAIVNSIFPEIVTGVSQAFKGAN